MEIEEVLEAVTEFFGDTSRAPAVTRDGLREVIETCETLIETLKEDENHE